MAVFNKVVTAYCCERCQHEWVPRSKVKELPTVCPKCKSPYWNEPRKGDMPQREHRRGIEVGPGLNEVSPVTYWYRGGHFANDDEALGAFKLAYQQGLDGMGQSIAEWMGVTDKEYDGWMRNNSLPRKGSGKKK